MTVREATAAKIFLDAVEQYHPSERLAFVKGACNGDTALVERVELLLKAHDQSNQLLDGNVEPTEARFVPEPAGTQIGPFKLLQELGRGGMGIVYMAEQTSPVARRVALKIIKPGMDTGQVIARFEVERQALAMMDHPNIAKVLDAGATDSGRPYFVMELVKGIPITQYCDEQHLAPKERLALFVKVCQAVQHAHQKGVIHRDLKPTNVLVAEYDQQAVPKIIDFGVAKATNQKLTEKTMFTQFGQIMGTLEYMSPEQAKLNQLDIDTRSDVYSLGVLLYELLTGDTPFDRKRLHSAAFEEMLRIIREEEPPKPSTRLSGSRDRLTVAKHRAESPDRLDKLVKGDLDWIAMKALEKDRARRYETASSLGADVARFLNDEPIEARPPSRLYLSRKFIRKHKGPVVAASTIACLLVAGITGTGYQWYRAEVEAAKAKTNEAVATQANQNALQGLMQDAIAFALSQKTELTDQYIARMEIVGASPAQIETIRTFLLAGGDSPELGARLTEKILDLDPTNVAVRAQAARWAYNRGHVEEFLKLGGEAMTFKATEPEDFLLLSLLFSRALPENALSLLDKARIGHDSGFARFVRSHALCELALERDDLEAALLAREEASMTQLLLGNSYFSSLARLNTADITHFLKHRAGARSDELAELALEGDVAASEILAMDIEFANHYISCADHYEFVRNDIERAELAWQKAETVGFHNLRSFYAIFKLRHYGPAQALRQLTYSGSDSRAYTLFYRGLLLALSNKPQEREQARADMAELLQCTSLPFVMPEAVIIPMLLDDADLAESMLSNEDIQPAIPVPPQRPPGNSARAFLRNQITARSLVDSAENPAELAYAYQLIGLKALVDHDWELAMQSFEKSAGSCFPSWRGPPLFSAACLAQMERDTTWPGSRQSAD